MEALAPAWDALIGHAGAKAFLGGVLAGERIAPAYLFTGPDGIGKTLAARTWSSSLVCATHAAPCGACASCRAGRAGGHPDILVLERDPARQRILVDDTRTALRDLSLRPLWGPRRILLVPEANLLHEAAMNALLKTLEEPPGHAVIVLVSPTPAAFPATILSRCQLVRFFALSEAQVEEVLRRDPALAPDEAHRLAAASGGSVGAAWARRAGGDMESRLQEALDRFERERALDPVLAFLKKGGEGEGAAAGARAAARSVVDALERRLRAAGPDALATGPGVDILESLASAESLLSQNVNPQMVVADLLMRWRAPR